MFKMNLSDIIGVRFKFINRSNGKLHDFMLKEGYYVMIGGGTSRSKADVKVYNDKIIVRQGCIRFTITKSEEGYVLTTTNGVFTYKLLRADDV